MDFDDLYQNGRKQDLSRGKKIRFCCIFLAVAAVTGLVVWKLIPRSPEDAAKKLPANQPQAVSAESKPAAPSAEEKTVIREPSLKKSGTKKDASSGKKVSRPVVKEPVLTPARQGKELKKGIPGNGDLSPEADKPYTPEEPAVGAAFSGSVAGLEQLVAQKQYAAAARRAENLLKTLTAGSEQYRKILALLTQINWLRFSNRDATDGFAVRYVVKSGDQLGVIARKNKTTVPALMKANKIKRAGLIQIGQNLTVLQGPWSIRVMKKQRILLVLRNDRVFAGFDIGIGRSGKTPDGAFVLSERLKHPVYRTADGRVFKYGDRENQLGDYFLKLLPANKTQRVLAGFGIHGTPDETTVTRSLSNGCIRMRNADVEKLYCIVPSGTPVTITD